MTRDKENRMKAGREIDALVAEKVMGKKYLLVPEVCINGRWARIPTWIEDGEDPASPQGGRSAGDAPPRYSTDIADAWQVVAAMRRRKLAFVLAANGCAEQWSAWFTDGIWALGKQQNEVPNYGDPALLGSATADTAPLAICLAALDACPSQTVDDAIARGAWGTVA